MISRTETPQPRPCSSPGPTVAVPSVPRPKPTHTYHALDTVAGGRTRDTYPRQHAQNGPWLANEGDRVESCACPPRAERARLSIHVLETAPDPTAAVYRERPRHKWLYGERERDVWARGRSTARARWQSMDLKRGFLLTRARSVKGLQPLKIRRQNQRDRELIS